MRYLSLIGIGFTTLLASGETVTKDAAGIHSWAGWRPGQVSRAECPELRGVPIILHWKKLEPTPGVYSFDTFLGESLKAAYEQRLYTSVMIWVGPAAPEWIYETGVAQVLTDRKVNALGQGTDENRYPYYLSPAYKKRFFALIDALGAYVGGLPLELRERIVYVQSCEGSTGDGQPYKGKPLDLQYAITEEDWNDFRLETWKRYQKRFPALPILVNSDANSAAESKWLLDHMNVVALKYGMFSHGYHVSDNRERLANYHTLQAEAKNRGKRVLTRGEMDAELFVMGWSKRNIPQTLYWSGIFAIHCGLDIWNIPHEALKDEANFPAFAFFNKYAGIRDPATAPAAFCCLRDGLDASDFDRFPASEFGGKPGKKRDAERYRRIAASFATYGARLDDPEKVVGGGMLNRKRSGSNDVGWGILPSNYDRFLKQLHPGAGDVGLWNIDDTIYGRFARAFDHKSGKTQMRFKLDDAFFRESGQPRSVTVTINWLDKGTGTWSLHHARKSGQPSVRRVQKTDTGQWKTETVELADAVFGGKLKGADLALRYDSGTDTAFHMIELERIAR